MNLLTLFNRKPKATLQELKSALVAAKAEDDRLWNERTTAQRSFAQADEKWLAAVKDVVRVESEIKRLST